MFGNLSLNHSIECRIQKNFLKRSVAYLPLHPRNKLLLYNNYVLYVLSKLAWHLTIADLGLIWAKHNLDILLVYFVRSWLEIPVSATIDIALLSKDKFGLNIITFSTKFMQSQTSIRECLQNSKNHDIRKIHQLTSYESNIQFDQFSSARQVVKPIRDKKVHKICTQLTSQ